MRSSFDSRIARAAELARISTGAREVLNFYGVVAPFQKSVFENFAASGLTDVRILVDHFPSLIDLVTRAAPAPLVRFAGEGLATAQAREELLQSCWQGDFPESEEARFFGRVLLQPYSEYLATRGNISFETTAPVCPFCSSMPVVAALRGEGDGAKRWLVCSACATEWPFRRLICPNCGEEDKDRLPVYTAAEFEHVRVEACDRCHTYIKAVDLSRNGHAVPIVDELATPALNIWAEEHGYCKFQSNLLGM